MVENTGGLDSTSRDFDSSLQSRHRISIGNLSNTNLTTPNRSARNSISAISVNQERTLYLTFLCLTITFLVCHLPRIILNIYEVPMNKRRFLCQAIFNKTFHQPTWVTILTSVEKLTLIINSSINFFFYCLVGTAFRKQLCRVSNGTW